LPSSTDLRVREAKPDDYAAVGALTVAAYRGDGQTDPDHPYETVLVDVAKRSAGGTILVAGDGTEILGAVLFVLPGSEYAELSAPGEAEFRMLAVTPAAQRRGVGEALVQACLARARNLGCTAVVICVRDFAEDAQRLYKRIGFVREPRLDWSPMEGVTLLGLRCQL
jgi:ribosomal protein S18 acetylase RimI-like enzyme